MKLTISKILMAVMASAMMMSTVACQSTRNSATLNLGLSGMTDDQGLHDKASELQKKLEKAQASHDDLSAAETRLALQDVLNRIQSANRDRALLAQALYPQNQKRKTEAGDVLGLNYRNASQVQMGYRSNSLGTSIDLKPVSNTATAGIQ